MSRQLSFKASEVYAGCSKAVFTRVNFQLDDISVVVQFLMLAYWIGLVVTLPCVVYGSAVPRGIDPKLSSRYTSDTFSCFDGSKVLPRGAVNDDYCDCRDGSDEPGTAACSQGTFFCLNRGYHSRKLSSYFVDDGVCDCCDGSDEQSNICNDICAELGQELREELQRKEESYREALKEKSKRLQSSGGVTEKWKEDMATCLTDIDAQRARCSTLQEQVDSLEAENKKKAAEEGATNQTEVETEQETETTEKSPDEVDEDETAEAEIAAEDKPSVKMHLDSDDDDDTLAHREDAEDTEYQEDRDYDDFDHNYYGAHEEDPEEIHQEETEDDDDEEELPVEIEEEEEKEEKGFLGRMRDRVAAMVSPKKENTAKSERHPRTHSRREETELEKVKREHAKEKRELRTLEEKRDDLQAKIDRDYGPESRFITLVDQCFQLEQDKYTYEICFFDKASQKENRNQVNLGRYEGFGELYDWLEFLHGQRCANGKSRSLRVHFICGVDDAINSVSEPDICEYSANFSTPVACSEAELEELKKEVELIGLPVKDEL